MTSAPQKRRAPRVLTPAQVRLMNEHPKAVVNILREIADDRDKDDRMRTPNATDVKRGYTATSRSDREELEGIVRLLIAKM